MKWLNCGCYRVIEEHQQSTASKIIDIDGIRCLPPTVCHQLINWIKLNSFELIEICENREKEMKQKLESLQILNP